MRTALAPPLRWTRVHATLAAVLVAAAMSAGSGLTAFANTAAAVAGPALAGTTTIAWSGVKGISLSVPGQIADDQTAMTIDLDSGTYAFATMYNPSGNCATTTFVHCAYQQYYRLAARPQVAKFAFGPLLKANTGDRLEFYLATDGKARITLSSSTLLGQSSLVAELAIPGIVKQLPNRCPASAGCDQATGYAGRIQFGGDAVDVGPAGFATVVSYSSAPDSEPPAGHFNTVCLYPNAAAPTASTQPSAYPLGCGPSDANSVFPATNDLQAFVENGTAGDPTGHYADNPDASGATYLGFQVASAAADPATWQTGALGFWFPYGIPQDPPVSVPEAPLAASFALVGLALLGLRAAGFARHSWWRSRVS